MIACYNGYMRDTEAAYLAGIVDGEGSISLTRVKQKGGYWRVVLTVSSCDKGLIEWCARWGGATLFDMDRGPNRRLQHRWTIVGQALRKLLKDIRPYLIIKADRAKWAAEGLDIISQPRKPYTKRNPEDVEKLYKLRQQFDKDRGRSLSARNRPKVVMP